MVNTGPEVKRSLNVQKKKEKANKQNTKLKAVLHRLHSVTKVDTVLKKNTNPIFREYGFAYRLYSYQLTV